jgi:hypothetical protein
VQQQDRNLQQHTPLQAYNQGLFGS